MRVLLAVGLLSLHIVSSAPHKSNNDSDLEDNYVDASEQVLLLLLLKIIIIIMLLRCSAARQGTRTTWAAQRLSTIIGRPDPVALAVKDLRGPSGNQSDGN